MKGFLFLFVFLWCQVGHAWNILHETDELKVWKSSKYKGVYLSEKIINKPSKLYQQLDKFDLTEANMKKRGFLSLLGLGHWTIKNKKINSKNNSLMMIGNYIDRQNQLNFFLEFHHYQKLKNIQILITTIKGKVKLEDVLKDFQKRKEYQ